MNRVLLKCPNCGNRLYREVRGWYLFPEWAGWIILGYSSHFIFITGASGWVVAIAIGIPYFIATRRLYHAYWHWRHPQRCGDHGHIAPQPNES